MDIVKLQSYSKESGVNFVLPLVTRGRRGKNMYFVVWPCQDPWDARKTGQVTTALANNCPSPRQQLLRLHICSGFTTDMCWDNCPCVTTDQVGQTLVWIFRLGVNFIFPYPKNKNNNKKFLDPKFFQTQIFFVPKFFPTQILFQAQICFDPKFFWTQNFFGPTIFLDPKFVSDLNLIFGPNFF